jgi:hypothetical protein
MFHSPEACSGGFSALFYIRKMQLNQDAGGMDFTIRVKLFFVTAAELLALPGSL